MERRGIGFRAREIGEEISKKEKGRGLERVGKIGLVVVSTI